MLFRLLRSFVGFHVKRISTRSKKLVNQAYPITSQTHTHTHQDPAKRFMENPTDLLQPPSLRSLTPKKDLQKSPDHKPCLMSLCHAAQLSQRTCRHPLSRPTAEVLLSGLRQVRRIGPPVILQSLGSLVLHLGNGEKDSHMNAPYRW